MSILKPEYYRNGDFDVIDVANEFNMNFNMGNCLKYIVRAGNKEPDKFVEDLEKAKVYLEREIKFRNASWTSEEPDFSKEYFGRVRYRGELIPAKLSYSGSQMICRAEVCVEDEILNEEIKATFKKPHKFIASGQVIVFYDEKKCMGGGIIE